MALSEQQYIALCKKQIEEKFSFGKRHGYVQRDLEILSQHIEEKTGVSISLSTLKRLWKNDFKQSPQLATLNALVAILDYKDWQHFKLENRNAKTGPKPLFAGVLLSLVLLIIAWFVFSGAGETKRKIKINGPIEFTTEKTVTSGIPNTVIFKYDVSNVDADSFYIQQSWNEKHRFPIDPAKSAFTNIYYESGFHRARLIANDSMISMQPIHILSDGWDPHIYYSESDLIPVDFKNEDFINDGRLYLDQALLKKRGVDLSRTFLSRITNSQEFDIPSDNFSLTTRIKSDSVFTSLCPWMTVIMVTDVHIFSVGLQKKGCERYAWYKMGEITRGGGDNDLSALGCDVYDWQNIQVSVREKNASIYINGELALKEKFKEDFGDIVALLYIFEGTGSIDYVRLDGPDENTVFVDDFEGGNELVLNPVPNR